MERGPESKPEEKKNGKSEAMPEESGKGIGARNQRTTQEEPGPEPEEDGMGAGVGNRRKTEKKPPGGISDSAGGVSVSAGGISVAILWQQRGNIYCNSYRSSPLCKWHGCYYIFALCHG